MYRGSLTTTAFALMGLLYTAPAMGQTGSATNVTFKKAVLDTVFRSEGVAVGDLNGDGKADIAAGAVWYEAPDWKMQLTGDKAPEYDPLSYSHAFQTFADDINGDGWTDLVVVDWPGAMTWWLENPRRAGATWPQHILTPVTNNESPQFVDVDGDGDNDVLSTAAHKVGMWWHEQITAASGRRQPPGSAALPGDSHPPLAEWKTHLIDDSFTQTHAVCLADINGDGLPDFVTGKRWWAHGPKGDINPGDPAVLFWFELKRVGGKPTWTPHQIDHDSGVGTQFEVADVNGDGLLDVVTSNKKGVRYFEQARK